jgi:elongation factor 1-beta
MTQVAKYLITNTADLETLEKSLTTQMYVHGHNPGCEDTLTYYQWFITKSEPCREKYPALWAWYALISLYNHQVLELWKAVKPEEKKVGGKEHHAKVEVATTVTVDHTKPAVKEPVADECDDLFDEETPEEENARIQKSEQMRKEKLEKDKLVKGAKPAIIAKSIILLDVKVFDMEQDLDVLAKKILHDIVKEGLVWKQEYQLLDVAFGIKKIRCGCVVEDDKVGVDDLVDEIQSWEEEVQSCDIHSFNKI